MKYLLLSMLMITSSQAASMGANTITVSAGPQWNWINYNPEMKTWKTTKYCIGGFVGASYGRSIFEYVSTGVAIEARISGGAKNFEHLYLTQNSLNPDLMDSSLVSGYFDEKIYSVGVSAHGTLRIPNTPIYFSAAVLPEYIIAVRIESQGVDEPMNETKVESETSSYDKLNLSGEFSVGFAVSKFNLFCKYDIGITDIAKHPYWVSSKKTNSLGFGLGYQIYEW